MAHEEKFIELIDRGVLKLDDEGRLWRLKRKARNGYVRYKKPVLAGGMTANGYVCVKMRLSPKKAVSAFVHRIIYLYHNRDRKLREGYHVHHIDGDKTNNVIGNLAEVEPSENARQHYANTPRRNAAKLTVNEVLQIRKLARTQSISRIALKFCGVHVNTIKNIVRRKTWKHVSDDC